MDNFLKSTTCPIAESARKLEVMLSMFVAEHNIPFTILDHLNNIIKEGVPDSQISKKFLINRAKGQKILTNLIGPANTDSISIFCQENYYSLVVDESNDVSVSKNLAVVIRIFDGQCRDRFLGLVHLNDCTANGIFESTTKMLNEYKIPIKYMVGITTDTCSVITGLKNGVQTKFKELVPSLFKNGCICHILILSSAAASEFALPKEIDKFIKRINHHFCNNSSRRDSFMEFQQYFGAELHNILKFSSTRWLSRQEVVNRILEQWEPLKYYFTLSDFEAKFKKER